jgi:hypothetical protein
MDWQDRFLGQITVALSLLHGAAMTHALGSTPPTDVSSSDTTLGDAV